MKEVISEPSRNNLNGGNSDLLRLLNHLAPLDIFKVKGLATPSKAWDPMVVNDVGNATVCRFEFFQKALAPISVTPLGITNSEIRSGVYAN